MTKELAPPNVVRILKPDKDGNLKEVKRIPVAPWRATGWENKELPKTSYAKKVRARKYK